MYNHVLNLLCTHYSCLLHVHVWTLFTLSHQVLRLDITPMTTPHSTTGMSDTTALNSAHIVTFAPDALNQLLVITSGSRLLKFNASNGQLLSEVSHIHRTQCTAVSVSNDGRYLLTTGDNVVKVWDYGMSLDLNFQVCLYMYMYHTENSYCIALSLSLKVYTNILQISKSSFMKRFPLIQKFG